MFSGALATKKRSSSTRSSRKSTTSKKGGKVDKSKNSISPLSGLLGKSNQTSDNDKDDGNDWGTYKTPGERQMEYDSLTPFTQACFDAAAAAAPSRRIVSALKKFSKNIFAGALLVSASANGVRSAPVSNNALSNHQPTHRNNPQSPEWPTLLPLSESTISSPILSPRNPFAPERTSEPKTPQRQRIEKRWSKRDAKRNPVKSPETENRNKRDVASSKAAEQRRRTDQARPLGQTSTRTDSPAPGQRRRTDQARPLGQTSTSTYSPVAEEQRGTKTPAQPSGTASASTSQPQGGNCEVNLNIKTKQFNRCDQKLEKCNNARMGDQIELGKCQARAENDIDNMPEIVVTEKCQNLAKQKDSSICHNQNAQEVKQLTKKVTKLTNENTLLKKENNQCQNSLTQANQETTRLTQKLDITNTATAQAESKAEAHAEATIGTGAGLGLCGVLGAAAVVYGAYQKGKSKGAKEERDSDAKNKRKSKEQEFKELKEWHKANTKKTEAVAKILKEQAKHGDELDKEIKVELLKSIKSQSSPDTGRKKRSHSL